MRDSPWFKTESVLCALVTLIRYDKKSEIISRFNPEIPKSIEISGIELDDSR